MVFTVRGLNRELLTHYVATWPDHYPTSLTRSKVRERLRSFPPILLSIGMAHADTGNLLGSKWTNANTPAHGQGIRKVVDAPPTLQLSREGARLHALIQLMRWSGIAISGTP